MDVSKNSGFSPQIIHFVHSFSMKYTIHFGVPLFLETPIYCTLMLYDTNLHVSARLRNLGVVAALLGCWLAMAMATRGGSFPQKIKTAPFWRFGVGLVSWLVG